MRKKLPFCVGLLLRLLRKNLRVFVTCTSGFDRSPACVIAYLHWMTDVSLHAAYTWVTGMHNCRPDREYPVGNEVVPNNLVRPAGPNQGIIILESWISTSEKWASEQERMLAELKMDMPIVKDSL
ncbi:hypothetical protein LR48_Vigan03g163300 [Vigna angularis]|uniref:Tyrosine specific protein phosphatases domain-containing protein n=1 Tax=Phaseolus angularis TaxID=3914 RepID=A0A0L9U657_PHAAN|nr:hypothetical protein LR48_Vigan03g163300 [Vigna angularis]